MDFRSNRKASVRRYLLQSRHRYRRRPDQDSFRSRTTAQPDGVVKQSQERQHGIVFEIIPKVIEFSELGMFFDVPIKTYSSGMLARLGFSLATQLKPDILLLDEVLAVGDEHFQRKSYFRMMKLIEKGSAVVLVSHNMTSVEQTCSRAVFLSGGKIVQDGPPEKVIARYRKDTL